MPEPFDTWNSRGLGSIREFMRDTPTPLIETFHELTDADDGSSVGQTKIGLRCKDCKEIRDAT